MRVADILNLLSRTKDVAQGDAMIQISLKGKLPKVSIYGNAMVHNAKILMFDFDEANLDFGDEFENKGSYFSDGVLHIAQAELRKNDEFVLRGSAQPWSTGQSAGRSEQEPGGCAVRPCCLLHGGE